MQKSLRVAMAAFGLTLGAMGVARSQTAPASLRTPAKSEEVDARWRDSLDAFAAADQAHAPKPGGVLFVGSSSIRLWDDLETEFDKLPVVVKRGFGGSRMSDCTKYLERLVVPYKPKLVIVYAGDNDLAEGATPADVMKSFAAFVQGVREELPNTRIAYLSIKPSPLRESLMPAIRETNALIAAFSTTQPNLDYIDIYSKMLGPDGHPRAELFREDHLHLNHDGYALWKAAISSHLAMPPQPPTLRSAAVSGSALQ
jgi:lysophospholipase L1-like esterase